MRRIIRIEVAVVAIALSALIGMMVSLATAAEPANVVCRVSIEETAGVNRKNWPIVLSLEFLEQLPSSVDRGRLAVKDGNRILRSQVDRYETGDESRAELAFQMDLSSLERRELSIVSVDSAYSPSMKESELRVSNVDGGTVLENSVFTWRISDAEDAEFRLKSQHGHEDNWNLRIWSWAGRGHVAPLHDHHYRRRRLLNQVRSCKVLSTGPVRAIVKVCYDSIHFEENLDVEETLIVYSNSPIVERISTSRFGEPGIVLATMLAKMGPQTIANGARTGESAFTVHYPRIFSRKRNEIPIPLDPDMNFEPISTQFDPTSVGQASYRPIESIDGVTWGAVWNPKSRQGKAEIALIDDVAGYITGWEQDRQGDATHPSTDRVFGDFLFRCTSKRIFRHYTAFFTLDAAERDPSHRLDALAKAIARPIALKVVDKLPHPVPQQRTSSVTSDSCILLDAPKQVYVGEAFQVNVKCTGVLDESEVSLELDRSSIAPRTTLALYSAGTHTIKAAANSGGEVIVVEHQIRATARPPLVYVDLVSRLSRPDQRTLHGNLVRYWGGQPDIYWKEYEPETLGFSHAWYFNGRNWGSFASRDWEFWRKEKTAYGTFQDRSRGRVITHPVAKRSRWEPGRLDLEYDFDGIDVYETKFIADDVLSDRIRVMNRRKEPVTITLSFKGTGHGASEAHFDKARDAIVVDEHAYSYTGLKRVFVSSRPFSSWSFRPDNKKTNANSELTQAYGNPVEYDFAFDIKLAPREMQELTLALALSEDLEKGYQKARYIAAFPDSSLHSVRWDWNHWLNYEVPRFQSSDQKLDELYYYLWFVFRCNFIDANTGWYRYGYSAPTASTYFMTIFGWDSAFNAMIGKWLAHPESYAYGNLRNWTLAQAPCGFLPEFFGQDWRCTWGHRIPLMCDALHQLYRRNGNVDIVREIYPMLKKSEQWESCEIEYSPYWKDYFNNIPDFEKRRNDFRAGKPWVSNELSYYEQMRLFALLCDDTYYMDNLDRKVALCREHLLNNPVCRTRSLGEVRNPGDFGRMLYWAPNLARPERVGEIAAPLQDRKLFPSVLHVAATPLADAVSGDGWDHGTSITVNYFLNVGLFLTGRPEEALSLLFAQVEASFVNTSDGLKPVAPEFWDVKGEPWGCVEYSWNALLNSLLIEHVAGVQPDVPDGSIIVAPNLPERLNFLEVAVPFDGVWTSFRVERLFKPLRYSIQVTNCPYDLTLRFRVPAGMEATHVENNGVSVAHASNDEVVEVKSVDRRNATVIVSFEPQS